MQITTLEPAKLAEAPSISHFQVMIAGHESESSQLLDRAIHVH